MDIHRSEEAAYEQCTERSWNIHSGHDGSRRSEGGKEPLDII